jgi:transcriptional regulator with XRE-family HTH domain
MMTSFGSRLTIARKMKSLSQQDLANLMGGKYSKQTLSKYEKDQISPNSSAIWALANALEVSVDFFFSVPSVKVELRDFTYHKIKF